jgi:hypothetical protein
LADQFLELFLERSRKEVESESCWLSGVEASNPPNAAFDFAQAAKPKVSKPEPPKIKENEQALE